MSSSISNKNKLCTVAYFDSKDFFQWHIALSKYASKLGLEITTVNASPTHKKVYSDFEHDLYWNPLREADYLFVYCTRRSTRNEPTGLSWWTLPKFVKPFMKPTAKMVVQYDDEFVWLFDPKHVWWDVNKMPNPDNLGGPEQFFKKTGILEIPDAYLTVIKNSPYTKYTTKPSFKLLLPQLCRYIPQKYSEVHKGQNIAMLIHSIKQSSIHGILENVIRPNNFSVTVFSGTLDTKAVETFRATEKLPVNSEVFERINYDCYTDLLWQNCSIGLDDNVGYYGWSRFAMECAVARVPCIGSTESVQDIFPELHTAPQDYAKQTELIKRLKTDKKFYHEMVELGHKRVLEVLDDEKLCRTLLDIFEKISPSKSNLTFKDVPLFHSDYVPDSKQARPHP